MRRFLLSLWTISVLAQGSPDIVISQIYGGGGNSGAPFRNDFIELLNRGAAPLSVDGWTVQYTSANGSEWQSTSLTGTIPPGRYYLIQQAEGANAAAAPLPFPDANGMIPMSSTAGKVAVVRNSAALIGASPASAAIADLVAYTGLSNTTAALRKNSGCVDTDDSSADFQTAAPRPRNGQMDAAVNCDAAPPEATPLNISEIQGPGAESPVVGRLVVTRGVITGRKSNGFFLQSTPENNDNNPQTSEGLFVFTSNPPPVAQRGNLVEVTGTVAEFRPASDPSSLPLTELIEPTINLVATGQPLPNPFPISTATDLEPLEGMRVSAPSLHVVGPTLGSISEVNATATSNGVFYAIDSSGLRPFASPSGVTGSPLIRVDTRALGRPALDVRAGDLATGAIGPLDFGFGAYTIDTETDLLTFSRDEGAGLVRRDPPSEFAVASMNLQRLFDAINDPGASDPVLTPEAYQRRIDRTARVIRDVLQSPEIIGVSEVENLPVLQSLAEAIGGYEAYLLEGNDIGGIDVGVLARRDRVSVQSFSQEGKDTQIDGGNILNDRPPVLLRAEIDGLPLVVVVNHLRSLIDAESPVVARKRRLQAEFLSAILGREIGSNVISIGDYNMNQFDDLMQIIKGPGLINLNDTLPPNEAYTYVQDGVTQSLDHVLVGQSLLPHLTRYQIAHINADLPATAMDRISDHDFPIAYFSTMPQRLRPAAITNAATFQSGSVAPDEWITLFTPGPVSQVTVGGEVAMIVSSGPSQTTAILPPSLTGPTTQIVVEGTTITKAISSAAPGIFTLNATGQGQGAILNQDTSINGSGSPADRGSIVSIYATGLSQALPMVWIGRTQAAILNSARMLNLPRGIFQISARVPVDAPTGSQVPIFVVSGTEVSAPYVTISVR